MTALESFRKKLMLDSLTHNLGGEWNWQEWLSYTKFIKETVVNIPVKLKIGNDYVQVFW